MFFAKREEFLLVLHDEFVGRFFSFALFFGLFRLIIGGGFNDIATINREIG